MSAEQIPTLNQRCTCEAEFPKLHADVESLHRLMADGMTQRAASAFLWGAL